MSPTIAEVNSHYSQSDSLRSVSRRNFLWELGGGFASLALVDLLGQQGFFDSPAHAEESRASSNAFRRQGQALHLSCS